MSPSLPVCRSALHHYACSRARCEWEGFEQWSVRAREMLAGPAAAGLVPPFHLLSLPAQGLLLCCFNQAYKFMPELFAVWCGLLARTPGSALWLLHSEAAEGNLRRAAMAQGIAPARLVFAPELPQAARLARLQQADLVLDTAPNNADTTASDALWAGVPLLTWAGEIFASRVAGSLLHAVALPEFVTHSLADHVQLAGALLAEPAQLQALRAKLARLRPQAALFDVAGYTRDLEALYLATWARHAAGLPPQALGAC